MDKNCDLEINWLKRIVYGRKDIVGYNLEDGDGNYYVCTAVTSLAIFPLYFAVYNLLFHIIFPFLLMFL